MTKDARKIGSSPARLPWRPITFAGVQFAELRMSRSGMAYVDAAHPPWWERPAVKAMRIEHRAIILEALGKLSDLGWHDFISLPNQYIGPDFALGEERDAYTAVTQPLQWVQTSNKSRWTAYAGCFELHVAQVPMMIDTWSYLAESEGGDNRHGGGFAESLEVAQRKCVSLLRGILETALEAIAGDEP